MGPDKVLIAKQVRQFNDLHEVKLRFSDYISKLSYFDQSIEFDGVSLPITNVKTDICLFDPEIWSE